MLFAGDRLADFQILVGNEFTPGDTVAAEIGSWSECAYVSGEKALQFFCL